MTFTKGIYIVLASYQRYALIKSLSAFFFFFNSLRMPDDPRLFPTVGNGHIATAVYSDTIYMNGFYNGYAYESHRARIPSPCAIKIRDVSETVMQNEYALNLEQGKVDFTL